MTEFISAYVKEIDQLYRTGLTTEHSFRPALQRLLQDCLHLTAGEHEKLAAALADCIRNIWKEGEES